MPGVDVALVRPPYPLGPYDQLPQEPLGLCSVAAAMRHAGLDVVLIDAEFESMDADGVLESIEALSPAVVGVSVMGRGALPGAMSVSRGVRSWAAPAAHVTMGGVLPTAATAEILSLEGGPHSIVRSEGEVAGAGLALAVREGREWRRTPGVAWVGTDGTVHCERPSAPPDLSALPAPARDLLPRALALGRACCVSSSRGCVGACSFCSVHGFYREGRRHDWHPRPAAEVVAELEVLHLEHGVADVVFNDDDFIGHREGALRAVGIAEGLRERGLDFWFEIETRPDNVEPHVIEALADAGLRSVFLGVESATEPGRHAFGKRIGQAAVERAATILGEHDIVVRMGYIMFHPRATLAEIRASAAFLAEHGQANPHSLTNALNVEAGTQLQGALSEAGLLCGDALDGYRWRFADEAVGRLHAVALIAVEPLFPEWYALVRERSHAMTGLHGRPIDARIARRLEEVSSALGRVESLALEVFAEAMSIASSRTTVVAPTALGLRDTALEELRSILGSRVGVSSCARSAS